MVAIGKKFGQFRQWTGEKLGTAERTSLSEDFKRLDIETESRKDGIEKLTIGLTDYAKTLDKRSSQDKKVSVLSILAKSMTQQGNFHGEHSRLGIALKCIGDLEDKIDALQQQFAESLRKGILMEIMALHASMKDYAALKKKLEMRRLDYDAKLNKLNKSKKEKPGLEEEMKTAQKKYHETLNDVEELMATFAQREESLLGPLLEFSQSQLHFFEKAVESMKDAQNLVSPESLERAAAERSKTPDKASMIRRNSSLKTILPAGLSSSSGEPPAMPPPTPDLVEPRCAAPPQIIGNISASSKGSRPSSPRASLIPVSSSVVPQVSKQGLEGDNEYVEALYDFNAEIAGEMSINRGDIIQVTKKIDDGWWEGLCDGRSGMFPANYVRPAAAAANRRRPASSSIEPSKATQGPSASLMGGPPASNPCCSQCKCQDFVPNVFKPGKCNNCFHQH